MQRLSRSFYVKYSLGQGQPEPPKSKVHQKAFWLLRLFESHLESFKVQQISFEFATRQRSISHELLGQLLAQSDLHVCHHILHYKGCATFGHIRVEYQIRQASTTTAMPFQQPTCQQQLSSRRKEVRLSSFLAAALPLFYMAEGNIILRKLLPSSFW